ncbi:Concanavalin A-like lectin/glucanases superfamily protein [uncultured archaeon]|nr:Concanavalin A-like lectin/glucanases superfamily protein [uncultured archaeon]
MAKGFVFAIDALLSVLVLIAVISSVMYFSSASSASNLPLLDLERKGSDMLVLLDKTGAFGSQNSTAIGLMLNQTLASNVAWSLDVEYYNATILGTWANNSFDRCRSIVITNAGSTALADFPAYVSLTYDPDMLANYSDLRFYDSPCSDDGSLLSYEIENYTAASANIWVRIPSLPAEGTTISVYYRNNTAVSSGQNVSGVWDSNFIAAWHLNENPSGTAPQFVDRKNGNDATARNMNSSDMVAGAIDGGLDFNGANASAETADGNSVRGLTRYTISAWVNTRIIDGVKHNVYEENVGTSQNTRMKLCIGTTNLFTLEGRDTDGDVLSTWATSTTPTLDTWYFVAGVFDSVSDVHHLFVNGVYVNNTVTASAISNTLPTDPPVIGARAVLSEFWDGTIDELEISNTARSADWLNQRYQMESNQSGRVGFGPERSRGTIVAFDLNQNATLGQSDANATNEAAAYREFVVENATTGQIDRYGRAVLRMWIR